MRMDIHNADVPVLCRACEARHRGICGALDAPELLRLGRTSSRHEYGAGTTLVAAGERPEHCSNILSGVVKLSKLLPDGRQQVVELQFAPDFLGRPFGG
ncbi:MAG: cyclic nucleotide-binding domain-containing protein, partial [Paracoccus sp. (in: a-proteobacteria)]